MGNYMCALHEQQQKCGTIRVVFGDGKVEEYKETMKAAELMVENSLHFVARSDGFRVEALRADEELRRGGLYFMMPMDRLNDPIAPSHVSSFVLKKSRSMSRRKRSNARILPVLGYVCPLPRENDVAIVQKRCPSVVMGTETSQLEEMLNNKNKIVRRSSSFATMSWRPNLQTICELGHLN